ncbi:hypothetical protein ACFVRB_08820 [Streptomyces nojiriensis]|uniref:hypothetical protein n=1 Tax=Streptomyces nojiriensis TaxID=66374 RepID=UPI0036DE81D6
MPIKKRSALGRDVDRLMGSVYGTAAARHARRAVAGKTGFAALGGWPGIVLLGPLTTVTQPSVRGTRLASQAAVALEATGAAEAISRKPSSG